MATLWLTALFRRALLSVQFPSACPSLITVPCTVASFPCLDTPQRERGRSPQQMGPKASGWAASLTQLARAKGRQGRWLQADHPLSRAPRGPGPLSRTSLRWVAGPTPPRPQPQGVGSPHPPSMQQPPHSLILIPQDRVPRPQTEGAFRRCCWLHEPTGGRECPHGFSFPSHRRRQDR